jgi:AcrR family transcriptional regulator
MNATPQTKKAQRAASTEKLLAAALNRFVGHGYRHTTVEAIALSAGLSKGAVYFYFGNKSALLLRLLDQVEAVVVDEMEARIASAGPSAPDMLIAFVHGQAMLGVERWEYVLLLILMSLEFRGAGGEIEARVTGIYARLYDAIEAIIEEGKAAGVFSTDLGTREQAAIVIASHDGTFLEWYRRGRRLDGEALVRALRVATLGGLRTA